MIKSLLIIATLAVSATANAQLRPAKFDKAQPMAPANIAIKAMREAPQYGITAKQRRSKANGLYYTLPDGTMFTGVFIDNGGYYYAVQGIYPAFKDIVFFNQWSDPFAANWSWDHGSGNLVSADDAADENNNLAPGAADPGSGYYVPVLTVGQKTYAFDELNDNRAKGTGGFFGCYGISPLAFHIEQCTKGYGYTQGNDTWYLYGTSTFPTEDGPATICKLEQDMPKPAAPLYVENIYPTICFTSAKNAAGEFMPVSGDKKLTLKIYNSETGELKETLTSEEGDYVSLGAYKATDKGSWAELFQRDCSIGFCNFTKKEYDPVLEMNQTIPFIIDYPMTMELSGFDQEGVDVGFQGISTDPADGVDQDLSTTKMVIQGDEEHYISFSSTQMPYYYNSVFDAADVVTTYYAYADESHTSIKTYENINVFSAPAEGGDVACYTADNQAFFEGQALVNTVLEWQDVESDNYTFEGLPEWIEPSVEVALDEEGNYAGGVFVTFKAEKLPAGETGRQAAIYVVSDKGARSAYPIVINQGEVADPMGIDFVTVDNKARDSKAVYNLNGQRVNANAKGLVIKGGKKMLVK